MQVDVPTIPARARRRLGRAVSARLGIDTRSLAALRIALGALLVADLLVRLRDLVAHYTDAGVLPRAALLARFARPERLSIHHASGEAWVQVGLFLVAIAVALCLLAGYRTTAATVVSWALLISLHNRNPLVLNAGDVLLRMLLLWGMFLPLGGRWSIDARRSGCRRSRVVGAATAAVLVQVVLVYAVNAVFKLRGDAWLRGEALYYVLSLDFFTVFLGDALFGFPALLAALDYLWLGALVASPLLLLLTGLPRAGLAGLLAGMHAGMLLTLGIGLFPLISIASLLPFLPGRVWDAAVIWAAGARARSWLPAGAARVPARLDATLPRVRFAGVPAWVGRVKRWTVPVVVTGMLVLVLLWNAGSLGYASVPEAAESVAYATRVDQHWRMFAPDPLGVDGWYVVPARLADGSRVDAFQREPVTWDRPPDLETTYPNNRWRKYLTHLRDDDYAAHRRYFADYLCRRWNRNHETDMVELVLYFMRQPTRPDYRPEPIERVRLLEYDCSARPPGV